MDDGWTGQPRSMSDQDNISNRMLLLPFSNPQGLFNDPNDNQNGDIGWYTFDALEQSCYDTTDTTYVNNPTGGVTRAAQTWHSGTYVSGMLDGHAMYAKGKSFATTGCWQKTYDFWTANFGNGIPTTLVAPNDWSAFYISPSNLQYWGEWWSSTD